MGNRCNVKVVGKGYGHVYLYSHWGGSEIRNVVRAAMLRGKNRWNDPSYLTRIIFSEMIKDDVMGETGFGISPEIHDGGHNVLVVNCDTYTICYGGVTETFANFTS